MGCHISSGTLLLATVAMRLIISQWKNVCFSQEPLIWVYVVSIYIIMSIYCSTLL